MTAELAEPNASLRWSVYVLLMFVALGAMLGRIAAVDSVDKIALDANRLKTKEPLKKGATAGLPSSAARTPLETTAGQASSGTPTPLCRPFLSANDRSRWCTVRALVESDMRVAGTPYAIDRVIEQPNWDTIDMVKHDGHLYSSKPPLLPTLMAAVYWPIHRLTGATLGTHPYAIGRFFLILFNIVPLAIYFVLLAALVERFGTTDWGRIFVVAAAVFGAFLTTFAVTINNHLPAAVCAVAAVYAAVRIWFDGERRLRYFVIAGLFGALATTNEFPALALLAAIALVLAWKAPRPTLIAFAPAVLVVAAAFFGTNWIAHRTLEPAYLHRGGADDWYDYTYQVRGRTIESYWKNPKGVDRGEASRGVYATHSLVGHHGIFSLTPIWLLSVVGLGVWMFRRGDARLRWSAAAVAAISLACIGFYLAQPLMNRNYGGVTSGPRWVFWLAPLWLLAMTPAADLMARRRWARRCVTGPGPRRC